MAGSITLTRAEYDLVWEHLDLGPFPPVLAIGSHGRTAAERDDLRRALWPGLTGRAENGGAHEDGGFPGEGLDGRLVRWLRRLARPDWEIDLRLHHRPGPPAVRALVAGTGRSGTVALLDGGGLTLGPIGPAGAVAAATALLAPHPAGTGPSLTVPADLLDAAASTAGTDPVAFGDALHAGGVHRYDARRLAAITRGVVRVAHFGAARTTGSGRRRAGHVVSVYDTESHRYLFTRRPGGGGLWATLTPGTGPALARQLGELLTGLG